MGWSAKADPDRGIVVVELTGYLTREEMFEVTADAIPLGQRLGITRFLIDAVELNRAPPISDILMLPVEEYVRLKFDRQSLIAMVLPKADQAAEAARFYVTACTNRNWRVSAFQSRRSAIEWLTGGAD